MTVNVPDRFKAANAFWIGLAKIGLTPAAVLTHARLPLTVYDGKKNFVTTAQFFALWRAVGELSADPAAGLKIATQIDVGNRPPSTMAAYYARDCSMLFPFRRRTSKLSIHRAGHYDVATLGRNESFRGIGVRIFRRGSRFTFVGGNHSEKVPFHAGRVARWHEGDTPRVDKPPNYCSNEQSWQI
jgi:hypothetical protein